MARRSRELCFGLGIVCLVLGLAACEKGAERRPAPRVEVSAALCERAASTIQGALRSWSQGVRPWEEWLRDLRDHPRRYLRGDRRESVRGLIPALIDAHAIDEREVDSASAPLCSFDIRRPAGAAAGGEGASSREGGSAQVAQVRVLCRTCSGEDCPEYGFEYELKGSPRLTHEVVYRRPLTETCGSMLLASSLR